MKKADIKTGDVYELNGNLIMITTVLGERIYASDVEFDEESVPFASGNENLLTDYEIKKLK